MENLTGKSEMELVVQNHSLNLNELVIDDNVVIIRFTFFLDVVSTSLRFSTDCEEGDKHWGVIVKTKYTQNPIVGICLTTEEKLKKALDIIRNDPNSILQINENTIVCQPGDTSDSNGNRCIEPLQTLNVSNSVFSSSIDSIDYYEINGEQLSELFSINNSMVLKNLAEQQAEEEMTAQEDYFSEKYQGQQPS